MSKNTYDFAIIGSGLSGLECAYILASEGYKVIVVEKNRQFGGSMQVFSRNRRLFDTGMHYIGGLDKGQNTYRFFKYFGIIDKVKFKPLDKNGFDLIKIKGNPKYYAYGNGYENFKQILLKDFPEEEKALDLYIAKIQAITKEFPMYNLEDALSPDYYSKPFLAESTTSFLESITQNKTLQTVLAGNAMLYAGVRNETPIYVHALIINSYIESAYRCEGGGSKIAIHLVKEIKKMGGVVLNNTAITHSTFQDNKLYSIKSAQDEEFIAQKFIFNTSPLQMLKIVGENKFRKAYVNRLKKLKNTISSFSLHLSFKPNTVKYKNHNIYYYRTEDGAWLAQDYKVSQWPHSFLISMPCNKKNEEYTNAMSVICYMDYSEVKKWENSFRTDSEGKQRNESYQKWKKQKENELIAVLEKELFPGIKEHIIGSESSTPLTYRDYIGSFDGNSYGTAKDFRSPIKSFINPKTKIPNVYLTGQYINLHGILGVTVSAFITCFEFIDRKYLVKKIKESNQEK